MYVELVLIKIIDYLKCIYGKKMLLNKNISLLVVHCSDTPNNQNLSAIDIHKMHLSFGWDGIGYHKIIKRSGKIENGRPRSIKQSTQS